jgi:WD40 repeat protein
MTSVEQRFSRFLLSLSLFALAPGISWGQQACPGPPYAYATDKGNIFSEQQEMYLGDVIAQQVERDFRVVHDEKLNAYLAKIGQRLLAQMPPTEMKFRFQLIDLPLVNAFTLPGGRIYVTRKLVIFARSEDELAGVLGHELGHGVTHERAAGYSRWLRETLGVTHVTDRADIFAKYNEFQDRWARKPPRFQETQEERGQLVADQYALYAEARAGFSPAAFGSFLDRLMQTKGRTGDWLSDFLGMTTPDQKRLRELEKTVPSVPPGCIEVPPAGAQQEFQKWQADVAAWSRGKEPASLSGLIWQRKLAPPLESDLMQVKFSPDGKHLLSQDDFGITIYSRQPFAPLFEIDAPEAEPAQFTQDSQSVVFLTRSLRAEIWNIATGQQTSFHEIAKPDACLYSQLSPDGRTVACNVMEIKNDTLDFTLRLTDLVSGEQQFEQRVFSGTVSDMSLGMLRGELRPCYQAFSPGGRYFAATCLEKTFAYDVLGHAPVVLDKAVKAVMSGGLVFLDSGRIFGINEANPKSSGEAAFPSGPMLRQIPMRLQWLSPATHGDYVVFRPKLPHQDYQAGLLDLQTGGVVMSTKHTALDVYDMVYVRERDDGRIALYDVKTLKEIANAAPLPTTIRSMQATALSPDLRWFAGSGTSRAGIWDLTTGLRAFHVRGFLSAYFSPEGQLYVDVPAYEERKRAIGKLDPGRREGSEVREVTEKRARQFGRYFVTRKYGAAKREPDLVVTDIVTGKLLWEKDYGNSDVIFHLQAAAGKDIFTFRLSLGSGAAAAEMKANPALKEQVRAIKDWQTGTLIQVLDAATGALLTEFPVDTGSGSFRIVSASAAPDRVVVGDGTNRVRVYSPEGAFAGWIFGSRPALALATGLLAVESDDGSLDIYDLATLTTRGTLRFPMALAHYQFSPDGKKLFALTGDQTAYLFDLSQVQPARYEPAAGVSAAEKKTQQ